MGYFVIKQSRQKNQQTILQRLSLYPSKFSAHKYLTRYNKYSPDKHVARHFEDKHDAELFARKFKGRVIQEYQQLWWNFFPVQIIIMLVLFTGGFLVLALALASPEQERFSINRYYIFGVALFAGGFGVLRNLTKRIRK